MPSYPAGYRGARFFKCDLQMQTPADPYHWLDTPMTNDVPGMQAAAEAYARRCYEEHLEVIAITDHNFASKDFIPVLRNALQSLAGEFNANVVMVLPGFELQAHVGKGAHVLAIFDKDKDLDEINDVLSKCGVAWPRFTSGKAAASTQRLSDILEKVQGTRPKDSLKGLVILPHAQSDAGIFDDEKISDWLQKEEYKNPELYCLEVPKRSDEMTVGWQRLFRNGHDCDPEWKRVRPIALIQSSDAKALSSAADPTLYIGSRYSWIKMSVPSVESLRQAFLDADSRIRLTRKAPVFQYARIGAIRVSNVMFLADFELVFGPNLNALIGGGGSGKSSIIEYMRLALHQDDSIHGESAQQNYRKLQETLTADSVIEVDIYREEDVWTLRSVGGGAGEVVASSPIPNVGKFFPVRFISQREIYSIAEDRSARIALLDNLIADELAALSRDEEDLVRELAALDQETLQLPVLIQRRKDLETERLDFESRKTALKLLEEPLTEWREFLADETALQDVRNTVSAIASRLRTAIGDARVTPPQAATEFQKELYERAAAGLATFSRAVKTDLAEFEEAITNLLSPEEETRWRTSYAQARAKYEDLRKGLSEKDAPEDPEQYLELEREIATRQADIAGVMRAEDQARELLAKRPGILQQLRALWDEQTNTRRKKAAALEAAVPATSAGTPFVRVAVSQYADDRALRERLDAYRVDGRRIAEEEWREFAQALAKTAGSTPPFSLLRQWIVTLRDGTVPVGYPWTLQDRQTRVLLEWLRDEQLAALERVRVPDRVFVTLNRDDGTPAGEMEQGLSVGQKCTAILALLLADDDAPIVIDQPEDDIDNEFTYRHLVPLLRSIKEQRQLIVATHDPNIPVNGDAELIAALEARDGRGQFKQSNGEVAVGALDRQIVRLAVEDIMEGSEEAFRRRFDKYGF